MKVTRKTAAILLAQVVFAVTGCAAGDPKGIAPPAVSGSPSAQPGPALPTDLDQLVRAAETANVATKDTVIKAGARPTLVDNGAQAQTMVIHDQDERQWQPGKYRLTAYCIGKGSLYAVVQMGAVSDSGTLPCSMAPQSLNVDISVPGVSAGLSVHIVPVGETAAGVAYQISKLPE